MSYSFSIQAAGKDETCNKIADEWDKIVASQPVHAYDREDARYAAYAFVDLLADPGEDQIISVSCNGYLSWAGLDPGPGEFTGASITISASVVAKPPPA